MIKTPPPYVPGLNYCHLFPKPTPLKKHQHRQTYAEYVAAFVPYVPTPKEERLANCVGKVFVGLFVLVGLVTLVVLVIA